MMQPINPAVILLLGFGTILWGLWVASPWWTVFPHAPLYSYMATFGPEYGWGAIAIFAGAAVVWGVIRASYKSLRAGALVGYIFWMLITVMYVAGDWTSTGPVTALVFALYSGFVALNIHINRKHYPKGS